MKRIFLLVALMATMMVGVNAQQPAKVPAYRGIIERVQPNGDTNRTYLRGDEHMHWLMMEDGWQIIETDKGWFKYAKKNRKGAVVAGCRKAHNDVDRSKSENKWLDKHGIRKDIR